MGAASGRDRGGPRVALLGATAADVRDVMVEGPSGLLAVCPPGNRPRYEPSKRRLTWPDGAVAMTFSADEPDRFAAPESTVPGSTSWPRSGTRRPWTTCCSGSAWAMTPALRHHDPQAGPAGDRPGGRPHDGDRPGHDLREPGNLAPSFFERIVTRYEGTRLGQQELLAELLEVSDGAWFPSFDAARHVTESAEYDPGLPVHLAIDCGVCRHVAAVWFQVRRGRVPVQAHARWLDQEGDPKRAGDGDRVRGHHREAFTRRRRPGRSWRIGEQLPARGRLDPVRLDPAASARTGIGPTAYAEFELMFGSGSWPAGRCTGCSTASISSRSCSIKRPAAPPALYALRRRSRTTAGSGRPAATGWTSRRPATSARGPDGASGAGSATGSPRGGSSSRG